MFFNLDDKFDREPTVWDLDIIQGQEKVLKSKYQVYHACIN